jgi:hypothetical protein
VIDFIVEHPYEVLGLLSLWAFGLVVVVHGFSKKQRP